jgi:hypothetical protein
MSREAACSLAAVMISFVQPVEEQIRKPSREAAALHSEGHEPLDCVRARWGALKGRQIVRNSRCRTHPTTPGIPACRRFDPEHADASSPSAILDRKQAEPRSNQTT